MIILRQKAFSEKSEKDKKKSRIAGGVAAGTGTVGIGSAIASKKLKKESNKTFDLVDKKTNRLLRGERVAKKFGGRYLEGVGVGPGYIIDTPTNTGAIEGTELLKRHERKVLNKAVGLRDNSKKLKIAGLALGAASLGSGAYGLKKRIDAKKEESKEDK